MFSINYKKNRNVELFSSLIEKNSDFESLQNYLPIYHLFFSLNDTNWNHINLNENNHLSQILERKDDHNYKVTICDEEKNTCKKIDCFFKLSPLIDPFRYLIGKMNDVTFEELCSLPKFDEKYMNDLDTKNIYPKTKEIHIEQDFNKYIYNKINNPYNTSYVDSFFSFLSSNLLNHYNFIHGIDFYGSFIGIKKNFFVNLEDDIENLQDSTFFNEKCLENIIFLEGEMNELLNFDTRKNKTTLELNKTISAFSVNSIKSFDGLFNSKLEIERSEEIHDLSTNNVELEEFNLIINDDINEDEEHSQNASSNESESVSESENDDHSEYEYDSDADSTTSSISSTNSDISEDSQESINKINEILHAENFETLREMMDISDNDDESNRDSDEESVSSSDSSEDIPIQGKLTKFPVNIICLEKMENTLDHYMTNNKISDKEWISIMMQIVMILITYQKAFQFTHNDLHTNNVMYNTTTELYIYYQYKEKIYKVPTYGKIYKLIDFGRATYAFKGNHIMCDAFNLDEDAYGQYNCEPIFNPKKSRMMPNMSFDLTRLATSLFDHFIPDETAIDEYNGVMEDLIKDWTTDDKGKNILYKQNGRERFAGFKLYKAIAKYVHKHIPENQLEREIFKQFESTLDEQQRESIKFINIDLIPTF